MALDPTNLANFDLLSSLQGNILKGHGRDHTTHFFIHFDAAKIDAAKRWIKKISGELVTSTQQQLKERDVFKRKQIAAGLFASFYLSAKGYTALGLNPPPDASFNAGMGSNATRSKLKDPPHSAWESGYQGDIHAMLLLAHDDEDEMGRIAQDLITRIDKFAKILHIEYGHAIRNKFGDGLEHFGYVDGVSQPLFLQDEVNEFKSGGGQLKWDPEAPLDLVLVQDIPGDSNAQGSYFVFRKLEQRVKAFNEAEDKLAERLGLDGDNIERAGAMIIGRYEDGTPLTMNEEDGIIDSGAANNFNYDQDALGAKCPFHAHIRKSNPRGTGLHESPADEKKHIMARRGIPFGLRNVNTNITPTIPQMPDDGVGLLFMSYQANLGNQFEFIQQNWVNNPDFPSAGNGSDPVLGQGIVSKGKFAKIYDDATSLQEEKFESFVKFKGGEYFFAPSITFLKSI